MRTKTGDYMHCVTLLVPLVQLVNTTLGTKTVASGDYMTHLVQLVILTWRIEL